MSSASSLKQALRTRRSSRSLIGLLVTLAICAGWAVAVPQIRKDDAGAAVADGINWALGAQATLGPTTSGTRAAALAVDGDKSTSAASGSRSGAEPFLQIDLESATRISTLRVTGPSGFWILLAGEAGIPGNTVAQALAAPGVKGIQVPGSAAQGVTVTVDATVRYIRIQRQAPGTTISVAEVEAFTDPDWVYVEDPGDQVLVSGTPIDLHLTGYGPGALTWEARGLPRGMSIDQNGVITGSNANKGRWPVEVTASDANGRQHTAKFHIVLHPGAPNGVTQEHPAVDPATLPNRPTRSWGVEGANASTRISGGNPNDTTPTLDVTVWDMQQVGEHMYVGGEFSTVVAPDGRRFPQAHLARFSIATGEWDPSFRPQLDGNVHALEVNEHGRLLVGGEFTSIDGVAGSAALAAIDVSTGSVDPGFDARLERRGSNERPLVRELEVVGPYVYVGGKFSHVTHGDRALRVYSATRVDAVTGAPDPTWLPQVNGGSVWGIGVDQQNGLVHLSGWFSSVEGRPETDRLATVDAVSGALVSTPPLPRNASQRDVYDVEAAAGRMWVAQSEHVLAIFDPFTRAIFAWNTAGYRDPWTYPGPWRGVSGLGGDFQFAEKIGDYVYAGCHCNRRVPEAHWSSVTQRYSDHIVANAYDVNTGGLFEPWNADVGGGVDGGWTAASDTRGCLWIGGDIVDGGFYEPGGRVFARGFARFCPTAAPQPPTDLTATSDSGAVTLSWSAPATGTVVEYLVYRDGVQVASVDGATTTFTETGLVAGASHVYEVRARDASGAVSPGNPTVTITVGGPDTTPPSVPADLEVAVDGTTVTLSWSASTDDRALSGYLVYRNGAYVGYSPGTSWTDTGLASGTYRYEVRATDAAGNRSEKSGAVQVQIGEVDAGVPSVPADLTATPSGDSVALSWGASTDDGPLDGYLVYRNGAYAGWTPATTWTDTGLAPGTYSYEVRAVDAAGNRSEKTPAVQVQLGESDTTPPSVPEGLTATPGDAGSGTVVLTWSPSTDDRALNGYLVYRNGAYAGWTPGTTWTDTGLAPGSYKYELRAQDAAGNRSAKTPGVTAQVS